MTDTVIRHKNWEIRRPLGDASRMIVYTTQDDGVWGYQKAEVAALRNEDAVELIEALKLALGEKDE